MAPDPEHVSATPEEWSSSATEKPATSSKRPLKIALVVLGCGCMSVIGLGLLATILVPNVLEAHLLAEDRHALRRRHRDIEQPGRDPARLVEPGLQLAGDDGGTLCRRPILGGARKEADLGTAERLARDGIEDAHADGTP